MHTLNVIQVYNFIISIDSNRSMDAQSPDTPPQHSYWYSIMPYSASNWITWNRSKSTNSGGKRASSSLEFQSIYDENDRRHGSIEVKKITSTKSIQLFIGPIDRLNHLSNPRAKRKHFIERYVMHLSNGCCFGFFFSNINWIWFQQMRIEAHIARSHNTLIHIYIWNINTVRITAKEIPQKNCATLKSSDQIKSNQSCWNMFKWLRHFIHESQSN